MRRENLTRLLIMLGHEVLRSTNPAHNRQVRDSMVYALQEAQRDLWYEFEWPHLMVERTVNVDAAAWKIDPPTDMLIDDVREIFVRYGDRWCKLDYGIQPEDYQVYDSELAETGEPVLKWRIYEDSQIEIWPRPTTASDATTLEGQLKFYGKRRLNKLVDEEDRCDLPARDIVLFAATKFATGERLKDVQAKWKIQHANLRAALTPRRTFSMFGLGCETKKSILRGPPRVHYRANEP